MFRACKLSLSSNKILSSPIGSLLINRKYATDSPITVTRSKTGITTVSIKGEKNALLTF